MSLLFKISTGQVESVELGQFHFHKFDEFLAKIIHSQLVNFHNTRCFKFQCYFIKMFLFFNEENLRFPELVLVDEKSRYFGKYMKFLMSEVYKVFF